MTVAELFVYFGLKPQGWDKAQKLVQGLRNAVRAYISVEAVKHIVDFVDHVTESATHLISLSNAMGLSVEKTQEWGYVAQQSGSDLKQLAVGFGMAERNLRNFARGNGGKVLADTMKEIGTSVDDAKKALASPDGMNAWLLKTSNRFKEMGATAERGALGQSLFGARAGRAVVADMARGSEAIQQLMDRRRQMSEISGEQATSLRDLHNRIKDLHTAFDALASKVIADLAPTLIKMAEAAGKWISENKDLISGALIGALTIVKKLFEAIGATVAWLGNLIHAALAGDSGAMAVLYGIAAAIASVVIPALLEMALAAWASLGPYALIAAAVAGVGFLIAKIADNWDVVQKAAEDFGDWLEEGFKEWGDALYDTFVQPWVDFGRAAKKEFSDLYDYISNIDWESIPFLGDLVKAGHWIGHKLNPDADAKGTRDANIGDLDSIDTLFKSNGSVQTQNQSPQAKNITNHITVDAPIRVDGSKDPAETGRGIAAHFDNAVRQAFHGLGQEAK